MSSDLSLVSNDHRIGFNCIISMYLSKITTQLSGQHGNVFVSQYTLYNLLHLIQHPSKWLCYVVFVEKLVKHKNTWPHREIEAVRSTWQQRGLTVFVHLGAAGVAHAGRDKLREEDRARQLHRNLQGPIARLTARRTRHSRVCAEALGMQESHMRYSTCPSQLAGLISACEHMMMLCLFKEFSKES